MYNFVKKCKFILILLMLPHINAISKAMEKEWEAPEKEWKAFISKHHTPNKDGHSKDSIDFLKEVSYMATFHSHWSSYGQPMCNKCMDNFERGTYNLDKRNEKSKSNTSKNHGKSKAESKSNTSKHHSKDKK